jgi:hypothetical protein
MVSALVLLTGVIICGWIASVCISLLLELDADDRIHADQTPD